MCVVEEFTDRHGTPKERPSHIVVEALGKSAESAMQKIVSGKRYFIEGYLREETQNGTSVIRLRAFVINEDKPNLASLKQALSIVKAAHSLEEAVSKLEEASKKE
jgi:single-stranded DNA-binding protein